MDGYKLNRRLKSFRELFSIRTFFLNLKTVINDPSIYSDIPRKKQSRRIIDNIIWLIKNHEINIFYNTYGLDVIGFRNPDDFVPYRQFSIIRDDYNLGIIGGVNGYNRICILRDKSVFSAFISETIGRNYVVPVLAETYGRFAKVYGGKEVELEEYFESRKRKDTILKKTNGECGEGVYLLSFCDERWTVNNKPTELKDFIENIEKSVYIVQDRIIQHKRLDEINPSSVNTIRFVTILDKNKKAQEFSHFLRIGVGDSITDNRATGGYAIHISSEGILSGRAIGHKNSIFSHPDTGFVFEGFRIPFWDEVRCLVKRAHEQLPDIKSIGWDVAITPGGPILIEGNDNWEIGGPQDMEGGLKKRWNKMMFE